VLGVGCGVCSGPLELRLAGESDIPDSDGMSPTNHRPGEHGDLFICRDCGTVQQPSLLVEADLHELYRDMRDDAYLDEEAGRRATANRLLDLIGTHVPSGRLLDIGCGHGLLLDEARRRGYEVTGLEISRYAAGHARDALGLDVHEVPLEEFSVEAGGGFSVIVMADVIEHLRDPQVALDRCVEFLRPGGVLCVVTPDPSSITARLAGRRWWGFLPAHTYLLPHRTLRELLGARGLVISAEVPLVRTFSTGYWLAGMAERSAPLATVTSRLTRLLGARRSLSLSLGDEPVVLAHKLVPSRAAVPLAKDRGGDRRVVAVLSAHNAAGTIPVLAAEAGISAADEALVVDDASTDATEDVALRAGLDVLRRPSAGGPGATQKAAYARAIMDGADVVVLLDAQDGHVPGLVERLARPIEEGMADMVVATRGPGFAARRRAGHRAFSASLLRNVPFLRNSDGHLFDHEIAAQAAEQAARVVEVPLDGQSARGDGAAVVRSLLESAPAGMRDLIVLARARLDGRWLLLRRPAARLGAPVSARPEQRSPAVH
jgi:SAM-dependent methyltransferase